METYVVSEQRTSDEIAVLVKELRALAKMQAFATVLFDYMELNGTDVSGFRARLKAKCDSVAGHLLERITYCYLHGVAPQDGDEEEDTTNPWLPSIMRNVLEGE
jgi:hypothetical protein